MRPVLLLLLLLLLLGLPLLGEAATVSLAWDNPASAVARQQLGESPTRPQPTSREAVVNAAATNAFVVQRNLDNAGWQDVASLPASVGRDIRWTDTSLPERAQDYQVRYRVLTQAGTERSDPSNEVTATVAAQDALLGTFYVSPEGDDARTCVQAQAPTTPKRTPASVFPCAAGGSKIYLRQGAYDPIDTATTPIRGGTSWATATLVASYPGETATLRPVAGGPTVLAFFRAPATDPYIILDRLVLDGLRMAGTNGFVCRAQSHHVRLQNSSVRNTFYEPVFLADSDTCELLKTEVTGNQSIGGVGLENMKNVRIEDCDIHDIQGHGIVWSNEKPSTATAIVRTRITRVTGTGILLGGGPWAAWNTLVTQGAVGIRVARGSTAVQLWHNTVYGMSGAGIQVDAGATATELTNNLLFGNGQPMLNQGAGTVQQTNLSTDPLFVDVTTGDFHLQPGSPARDSGTPLAQVATDLAGAVRPQGPGYDIGVYEMAVGDVTPPVPPTGETWLCTKTQVDATHLTWHCTLQ